MIKTTIKERNDSVVCVSSTKDNKIMLDIIQPMPFLTMALPPERHMTTFLNKEEAKKLITEIVDRL